MHGREKGHAEAAEQWQMQPIDVRVHEVDWSAGASGACTPDTSPAATPQ